MIASWLAMYCCAAPATCAAFWWFDACSSGTACFCILAPISARLASSCSKKGISEVATEIICTGDTATQPIERIDQERDVQDVDLVGQNMVFKMAGEDHDVVEGD